MSAALVALIVSLSASVWTFTRLQDRTGRGNNRNAVIGATAVFILGFIVIFTLVRLLLH